MKKSYITLKRLYVSLAKQHLEKGDMLLYDASMMVNNLTVYRGQQLVNTITHTLVGMEALVKAGIIAPVVDVTAPAPAPEPKFTPLEKVETVAQAAILKAEVLVGEAIDAVKHVVAKEEPKIEPMVAHVEAEVKSETPVILAEIKTEAAHVEAEVKAEAPMIETELIPKKAKKRAATHEAEHELAEVK